MNYRAFSTTLLAMAAGACLLIACGGPTEYVIVGTARAAGADGTIQVEKIEGGNNLVTVEMQHLPPPARLGEGLKEYIMWFETAEAPAVMEGRLEYDEKKRVAKGMATTPKQKFTVKITAEKGTQVSTPSDVVVAKQKVGH
jgi:hypothetical protein